MRVLQPRGSIKWKPHVCHRAKRRQCPPLWSYELSNPSQGWPHDAPFRENLNHQNFDHLHLASVRYRSAQNFAIRQRWDRKEVRQPRTNCPAKFSCRTPRVNPCLGPSKSHSLNLLWRAFRGGQAPLVNLVVCPHVGVYDLPCGPSN